MLIPLPVILNLFFYGFTLWLGAYLLAGSSEKMTVRLTGLGLVFYAAALAIGILSGQTPNGLLLLPALLWIGATLYLIPEETSWRQNSIRLWMLSAIPIFILTLVNAWFSLIAVLALLACVMIIAFIKPRTHFKNIFRLLVVIGLFFTLSTGLLVLPLDLFPGTWLILALGLDLILLGVAITIWDAFDEGEQIRSHILRLLVSSFYYAGALAAIVILAFAIDGEITPGALIALVGVITFGILAQSYSNQIQTFLDHLTLPRENLVNEQREILRETADELMRLSTLDPAGLDESEFARLTRRAISNLGDLPKLSASPLTNLPSLISQKGTNPLDRAHALKTLLTEGIQRLKPQGDEMFGTTDEWRYYNALYYPYVLGLKPYSRRIDKNSLDDLSSMTNAMRLRR